MVCEFLVDPDCIPYPPNKKWMQITKDWVFYVDGKEYWIPAGYWFDGASIPSIFWMLIGSPFLPQFWAAALPHDWGYLTHVLPKSVYDELFRQFLIASRVGSFKARIMWSAVRTGGLLAWGNTIADIEELAKIKSELNERPDGQKFLLTV